MTHADAVSLAGRIIELAALALFFGLTVGRLFRRRRQGHFESAQPGQRLATLVLFLFVLGWCTLLALHAIPFAPGSPGWLGPRLFRSNALAAIGVGLTIAAAGLNIIAAISLGENWRIGLARPARLVTTGIYGFSRNPIYLFFILWFWAAFLIHPTFWLLGAAIIGTGAFHAQTLREERFLREQFGPEFAAYCQLVGRYLGPRTRRGILATVGWLLSPLSWWNDAVVNLPLAWFFASLVSLVNRRLFLPAMVVGYWLTNLVGILLLAQATTTAFAGSPQTRPQRLLLSLLVATSYTLLILLLTRFGILRPLGAIVET